MKKYSKKIALILALTLILAVAIPALAAETLIDGAYKPIPIAVSVPGDTKAFLNPYGLPVNFVAADGKTEAGTLTSPGQIATNPIVGVNLGDVDLNVGATVVGVVKDGSKFKFATSAPSATSTAKSGLVYLQVKQAVTDLAYDSTAADAVAVKGGFDASAVEAEMNAWKWPAATEKYNAKATDVLTVGKKATSKSAMCKILAVDEDTDEPQVGSYFVARLGGSIPKSPKEPWVTTDGFDVTISWIFEPAPAPAPASSTTTNP